MQILKSKLGVTLSRVSDTAGNAGSYAYVVDDAHRISPWTWTFDSCREAEAKFTECVAIVEALRCQRPSAAATTMARDYAATGPEL